MTKGGDRGANSQIYLSLLQGCDDQNAGKFSINMKETELLPTVMDESKTEKQRLVAFLYNNQTLPSNFCTQFWNHYIFSFCFLKNSSDENAFQYPSYLKTRPLHYLLHFIREILNWTWDYNGYKLCHSQITILSIIKAKRISSIFEIVIESKWKFSITVATSILMIIFDCICEETIITVNSIRIVINLN